MADTYRARRLRHIRAFDRRVADEQRAVARSAGRLVTLAAVRGESGERIVPNTRRSRDALKQQIWQQVVKPYFVGTGADAFASGEPQSPFARLIAEGVEGATRIAVEQQVNLLQRRIRDRRVLGWLTGPRGWVPVTEQRGVYDPWHSWVDPAGYTLSDRVWRTAIEERARIDRLLDYHIAQGTAAVDIAELLEDFLTPGARLLRTRTPYGREGSYAARRLARTEISAAAGRATVSASIANPFVEGIQWSLSGSHPKPDICDDHARGGPNGDGVYAPGNVPPYPAHPHCLCNLQPVTGRDTRVLVEELRAEIRAATPRARALQGLFNVEFLTRALMAGAFEQIAEVVV